MAINERDLLTFLLPTRANARRTPNLRGRKSLNFQGSNARARNIEVEEVETVENVEATRWAGDQAYCFA